jgi:beta-galactosidase/beta-glucuronidase
VWLRFGAVDYGAHVWVNDILVGTHTGGHTPFGFDITRALRSDGNTIVVRAVDDWNDLTLPRGKQAWHPEPWSIFYTRTTGIWQSVWLEPLPDAHIVDVYASSRGSRLRLEVALSANTDVEVAVNGTTATGSGRSTVIDIDLPGAPRWTPGAPHLVELELRCGDDRVRTYAGLRDIDVDGGGVYLDGELQRQRLVLDQGYWPDGGLTAASDDALAADVEWVRALGFDGVRKHQKVEDPRWLYHCDRMGVLVWAEMANAYAFTADAARRLAAEWQDVVRRDRSHPSVVCWVPLNESWGVPEIKTDVRQQSFARSLYHLTKSLDDTRPVVDNDGWEHTDDTDLLTVHDYADSAGALRREWDGGLPTGLHRSPLTDGAQYRGQPVLVTEYGGISYVPDDVRCTDDSWGYGEPAATVDAFVERYRALTDVLSHDRRIAGWCYTQLTDVEQETNGLLTFDRRPKVDPQVIAEINRGGG